MAEKSSWDQANIRQKLGLVWRNRRKLAKLSKTAFRLNYFMHNPFIGNLFTSWALPFLKVLWKLRVLLSLPTPFTVTHKESAGKRRGKGTTGISPHPSPPTPPLPQSQERRLEALIYPTKTTAENFGVCPDILHAKFWKLFLYRSFFTFWDLEYTVEMASFCSLFNECPQPCVWRVFFNSLYT